MNENEHDHCYFVLYILAYFKMLQGEGLNWRFYLYFYFFTIWKTKHSVLSRLQQLNQAFYSSFNKRVG